MNFEKLLSSVGDDFKFEAERSRLIGEFLNSIKDERQRSALRLFQMNLDRLREEQPENFLSLILHQMNENVANMEDMASYINKKLMAQ